MHFFDPITDFIFIEHEVESSRCDFHPRRPLRRDCSARC